MRVFRAQKCVHNTNIYFHFSLSLKINIVLCSKCTLLQTRKKIQNDAEFYQS